MKKVILLLTTVAFLAGCKKKDTEPIPTPVTPELVNDLPDPYKSLKGVFNGNGIGAAFNITENIIILFNTDGDKYAWFEDGAIQVTRDLSDPNGPFEDCSFTKISAAAACYGSNSTYYFFDETGQNYTSAVIDPAASDEAWNDNNLISWSSSTFPLTDWGNDDCPFSGISAMWRWSNPGTTCFGASTAEKFVWMINETGDEISRYYNGNTTFTPADEIENWLAVNNCNGPDGLTPFETVGAAFQFVHPNKIQDVIISGDGLQFSYYNVSEGVFSPIYDINY